MENNEKQLGKILSDMYNNALKKEQVMNIHLFGIKYGEIILGYRLSSKEIIKVSGISPTYLTELHKGIKLSNYVKLK